MKKYTGDGILRGTFKVASPKPLDDRLVVNTQQDLYTLDNIYEGIVVSCMEEQSLYMLTDIALKAQLAGWKKFMQSSFTHVVLTQEQYDELQYKDNNTIYLIVEALPVPEPSVWVFGNSFPIILAPTASSNVWQFGDRFPIILT